MKKFVLVSLTFILLGSASFVHAEGVVSFKHFHRYPQGQWLNEMSGTQGGKTMPSPPPDSVCSAPLDNLASARIKAMANSVTSNCTMTIVTDEEKTASSEQVCAIGNAQQKIRTTMHAIDDKTILTEVSSSLPGLPGNAGEIFTKIKSTYQGPCLAGTPAATSAMQDMPILQPSAEDCADLPQMKEDIAGGSAQCDQLPVAYKAQCVTHVEMAKKGVAAMEKACH